MTENNQKTLVAIMYDFDKTLSTKDMQEFTFIPSLGYENAHSFWDEVNQITGDTMDSILSYMYMMLRKATEKNVSITEKEFVKLGKDVELHPGVETWFKNINKIGQKYNLEIEHYVISSGLEEIIRGTKISKYFKRIYACKFLYDANHVAVWPATVVNYTTKTQYIYRINKGILDMGVANDRLLNKSTPEEEKRIPFERMIYIADGVTDVPCMKLVKGNGGKSIAVYHPNYEATESTIELAEDGRVDFIAPADYTKDSKLFKIVSSILKHMAADYEMDCLTYKQNKQPK